MNLSFFLHDDTAPAGSLDNVPWQENKRPSAAPASESLHILRDRITAPVNERFVARPRLDALLQRSISQYAATLVCGRAGTGKTALAADFSSRYGRTAWYTVEASDNDWATFSSYFSASIDAARGRGRKSAASSSSADAASIAQFLVNVFGDTAAGSSRPLLIVLDDLHKIFDAEWFGDFFQLLLYSLPENCRLLLLCRSKPPKPLWRLRSKQVLNVIEESVLAFNDNETAALFEHQKMSPAQLSKARAASFGRVSKLVEMLGR